MTTLDHTALCLLTTLLNYSPGSSSIHPFSLLFSVFSQEQPAGPDLLWSLCRRAKPSQLAGRPASFDWVLVRSGRLVTGYLQRGQWGCVVLCGPEREPRSLLTPCSPRTWFYSNHDFPSPAPRLTVCDCRASAQCFLMKRIRTSSPLALEATFFPRSWARRRGPSPKQA